MRGFSRAHTNKLRPLETRLLKTIRPENCRSEHRIFTEKPHMAGSVRNYQLALHVAKQWKLYGLENVELIEHPVYLPWPIRYEATLVGSKEKLSLKEEPIPQDITNLGCYEFSDGEMMLTSLHPGCTIEQVKENTGWDVRISPQLTTTALPEDEELRIIREDLDPSHLFV